MEEFCPYRICPIGAHIDHQFGVVSGACIDLGVRFIYDKVDDYCFILRSNDFEGVIIFDIVDRMYDWADYFRGAISLLIKEYNIKYGLSGVFIGGFPVGGISSSTASLIVFVNAICKINKIKLTKEKLIDLVYRVEREYMGLSIGVLDPSSIVYGKSNCLMFLDTLTNYYQLVENMEFDKKYQFIIIFSGVKRELIKSSYNKRVLECADVYNKLDVNIIQSGKLRDIPNYYFHNNKSKLSEVEIKRANHYFGEMDRVKKALRLWRNNDRLSFGKLMNESCISSINNYECGSKHLIEIFNICSKIDGVLGIRFLGAGFNGSCIGLIEKDKFESIKEEFGKRYLRDDFKILSIKLVDGVKI